MGAQGYYGMPRHEVDYNGNMGWCARPKDLLVSNSARVRATCQRATLMHCKRGSQYSEATGMTESSLNLVGVRQCIGLATLAILVLGSIVYAWRSRRLGGYRVSALISGGGRTAVAARGWISAGFSLGSAARRRRGSKTAVTSPLPASAARRDWISREGQSIAAGPAGAG